MVQLRDSVFEYRPFDPGVGAERAYLHNFWTAEPIELGASYRFAVSLPGQEPTEALVEIPRDFGFEIWVAQSWTPANTRYDMVRLTGVKHVPFIAVNAHSVVCEPSLRRNLVTSTSIAHTGEEHRASIRRVQWPECGSDRMEVWVAGSEAAWPSGGAFATWRLGVPGAPSNLSHALGFVGGVMTKAVPYPGCVMDPAPGETHCRLRFDESTAIVKGTIGDSPCGLTVPSAVVELREIGTATPAQAALDDRIRVRPVRDLGSDRGAVRVDSPQQHRGCGLAAQVRRAY